MTPSEADGLLAEGSGIPKRFWTNLRKREILQSRLFSVICNHPERGVDAARALLKRGREVLKRKYPLLSEVSQT